MLELTLKEARALAIAAQRLDRAPRPTRDRARTKARLLETIRALGCVQLDTISVISRSHETVLWSRLGAYDRTLFDELYYPDGALFEYWAHAAALIPIEQFPYFFRAMTAYRTRSETAGSWAAKNAEAINRVLETIQARGPLGSRHFPRPDGPRPEAWEWWGGNPDRQALDHLWSRGDLAVQRRIGFQRVYDLTERVVPEQYRTNPPSWAEQRRHFIGSALRALGIASAAWATDYFRTGGRVHVPLKEAATELRDLERAGLAAPVQIRGVADSHWIDASMVPRLEELRAGRGWPKRTTLLSPFDNLIWHRGRTEELFDFFYRIECYTPAPRRQYGYYTLPILHREALVGRLDPLYSRRQRQLTIKAIHLEPRARVTSALVNGLAAALNDLNRFLGGDEIILHPTIPAPLRSEIMTALNRLPGVSRAADELGAPPAASRRTPPASAVIAQAEEPVASD